METLWNTYQWLKSPELVANFQNQCGIELSINHSCENHNDIKADHLSSPNGLDHAHTNGFFKSNVNDGAVKRNGFTKSDIRYEALRTKNGVTAQNGIVQNGFVHALPPSDDNTQFTKSLTEKKSSYTIKNYFFYVLFTFGASLGNEIFYIIFFPFLIWNVDSTLLRRMAFVWHLAMWLGQAAKDMICWPRPASPPVIKMEDRYGLEYGMPSTHSLVGAVIPFCLLIIGHEAYQFSYPVGFALASTWAILVGGSRMYLGMHTALDVLAGYLFACILIPIVLPWVDTLDHLQVTHPLAPLVTTGVYLLFCWAYPKQKIWNTCKADTANVHGICGGISTGVWLNYQLGWLTFSSAPMPYQLHPLTLDWVLYSSLRTIIGVLFLTGIRQVTKPLAIKFLCKLYRIEEENIADQRKYGSEVPQKFITYYMVSIGGSFLAPLLFSYLGICRATYYIELY